MVLSSQLSYYKSCLTLYLNRQIIFNYDILYFLPFDLHNLCQIVNIFLGFLEEIVQSQCVYIYHKSIYIKSNMTNIVKQKKFNINSSQGNGSAHLIISIKDSTLSFELREANEQAIYQRDFSDKNNQSMLILTPFFQSIQTFSNFLWLLNEKYINFSHNGLIEFTIFGQQLQIETLSIQLKKVTIADLMHKLQFYQRQKAIAQEQNKQLHKKHEQQLKNMKTQFTSYKKIQSYTIEKLQNELQNLSKIVHSKSNELFVSYKKHPQITVFGKRIINAPSYDNEVRWAIIGRNPHQMKNPYYRLKINNIDWLAFGFCREQNISQRGYSRFNGCGNHGCIVMDNSGWIYADGYECNYKQLGFEVNNNETVLVSYDSSSKSLTIMNQTSWKKLQFKIDIDIHEFSPCVACNKATDIQILEIDC